MVLDLGSKCQCGLHEVLCAHIGTLMHLLAAEPRSPAGLLFPCQYLCGTILVTQLLAPVFSPTVYSGVGNGLSSFIQRVIIVGLGRRTDRVLIALSQPCIANFFNN